MEKRLTISLLIILLLSGKLLAQVDVDQLKSSTQSRADFIQKLLNTKTDSLKLSKSKLTSIDSKKLTVPNTLSHGLSEKISQRQDSIRNKMSVIDSLANTGSIAPLNGVSEKIDELDGLKPDRPDIEGITPSELNNPIDIQRDIDLDVDEVLPSDLNIKGADIESLSNETTQLGKDVNVNSDDLSKWPAMAEENLVQTDQLTGFKSAVESTNAAKGQITESLNVPTELPPLGQRRARKVMIDQFVDKPEVINKGMEELDRLQKKYGEIADSRYLPKRRQNPEKGKPLIERIIFGNAFDVQQVSPKWNGVRTWPHVGFKFSDRVRSSIGPTYEFDLAPRQIEYRKVDYPLGFRASIGYKVIGSNFVVFEGSTSDNRSEKTPVLSADSENDKVLKHLRLGVLRNMKITKSLEWTVQYLLNLEEIKDFTFQRSEFRCGIQYCFIKKKDRDK